MNVDQPLFRTDLVAQPVFDDGKVFVDVTDPDSGKTFRFYDFEYSIACAMDGRKDVGGLVSWASAELGLATTPAELQSVITTLGDLGYLGDGAGIEVVDAAAPVASIHDRPTPAPTPVAPSAPRVETPAPAAKAPGAGVELGMSGTSRIPTPQPTPPKADDFELGMPGESPLTQPRPAPPKAADVELGFAGAENAPDEPPAPHIASAEIEVAPLSADTSYSYTSQQAPATEESFEGLMDDGTGVDERAPTQSTAPLTVDGEDIELGNLAPPPTELPVQEPAATLRPVTNQSLTEDDDEPTHLPPPQVEYDDEDVSVDLSAHLSVGTDELKEAVRQSKVMQAVDVPADLLAEMEADEQPTSVAVKPAPEPAIPEPPAPVIDPPKPEVPSLSSARDAAPTAVPVELPADKDKPDEGVAAAEEVERKPRKTSTGLIVFFILVLLGAGFAHWWFNMRKKDEPKRKRAKPTKPVVKPDTTKGTKPDGTKPDGTKPDGTKPDGTKPDGTKPDGTKPDGTKPTPAAVEFKLEKAAGAGVEVTMPEGSSPSFAVDDGAKVNAGDVVAKVGPWRRLEPQITHETGRITHYEGKVKALEKKATDAQAAGDDGGFRRFTAQAKRMKEAKLIARQKKIDKWKARISLKAPKAGTVRYVAKNNAWTAQGKPVFKIETGSGVGGTFTAAEGKTYKQGDDVSVSVKGSPDKKATCKVTAAADASITVDCSSSGFAAGDTLTVH